MSTDMRAALVERLRRHAGIAVSHPHLGAIASDCLAAADLLAHAAPEERGALYWPTDPAYPCPTCGHSVLAAPEERGEGERARELEEAAYAVYADACRTGQTSPALTRLSAALLEYHREDLEAMDTLASPPAPVEETVTRSGFVLDRRAAPVEGEREPIERCRKPGCGALKGHCTDWDCPEGDFVRSLEGRALTSEGGDRA